MTVVLVSKATRYVGTSDDTKPTNCAAGSTFTESDTGRNYIYSGSAWMEDLTVLCALSQVAGYKYYRMKLTIDQTGIDADLENFPVLVALTSDNFDFTKCMTNGYNIRFYASDETTVLNYDRERHDYANQVAEYWVQIPRISSTADTDFYICYGMDDATDGANSKAVWDDVMVQHMNDTTTSLITDSTRYGNNGTKKGVNEPVEAAGLIGKAQDYDATNDYISAGNATEFNITDRLTLSVFLKNKTAIPAATYPAILTKEAAYYLYLNPAPAAGQTSISGRIYIGAVQKYTTAYTGTMNTWYHVAMTYDKDGGAGNHKFYINGAAQTPTTVTGQIDVNASNVYIGLIKNASVIDEVRISNTARSAAWIKAEYNAGNNTLISFGDEEMKYALSI